MNNLLIIRLYYCLQRDPVKMMCSIRRGYISALGLNGNYISVTLFEAYKHREAPKILGLEKNT